MSLVIAVPKLLVIIAAIHSRLLCKYAQVSNFALRIEYRTPTHT